MVLLMTAPSRVLVAGKDGPLLVGHLPVVHQLLGHDGGHVGAGEGADEGHPGGAGDPHEGLESWVKDNAGGLKGAQLQYVQKAAEEAMTAGIRFSRP